MKWFHNKRRHLTAATAQGFSLSNGGKALAKEKAAVHDFLVN